MQFVRVAGVAPRLSSAAASASRRAVASYACAAPSHLYVVRHGARLDQVQPAWLDEAAALGVDPRDPPLSALGHQQARETAAFFAALPPPQRPTRILCSPYLRVLQTAAPTADALGLRLEVEEGLAELHHVPGLLPSPTSRFPYFPQLDPTALVRRSLLVPVADTVDAATGRPAESYPHGYLARVKTLAPLLAQACDGASVACFSHAASSALVAAVLGSSQSPPGVARSQEPGSAAGKDTTVEPPQQQQQPFFAELEEVGPFAPCGVFHLAARGHHAPWVLHCKGGDNTAHVSENNPATFPWPHPEDTHQAWRDLHSPASSDQAEDAAERTA